MKSDKPMLGEKQAKVDERNLGCTRERVYPTPVNPGKP